MGSPTLFIRLLGALDLRVGANPLPALESARAESLLAYLLLHREAPQPRQRLAFLLWPDSTERQARTNLRHLLHTLRRALPDCDRFIDVQPRTLQWRTDAPFWLDVALFEESLSKAEVEREAGGDLTALRDAIELYTEDLLPTCYDEWLLDERERLRQRYLAALEHLVTSLAERGEHSQAIPYAERLVRHDPLHEETYRLLMKLYDASGDRARALRTYHVCATTLERELGVEPSAQTREAYEALLPLERGSVAEELQNAQVARLESLPLVGRATEWMRLTTLWRATEGGMSHLVLVTGEPGVGKTRLVEDFRSWCAHRGALTVEARSYAAEGALAYAPVVAWLRSEAIMARIRRLDYDHRTELARLLPELHMDVPGLAYPDPLSELPESAQRQRLFDALARALLAPGSPLLLVADDLQWCDRETLQFLHYLLRYEPGTRVLVAATARREELDHKHPLPDLIVGVQALERFTEIPLERLTREETAMLARRFARTPLEEPKVDQLYRETEGNPLFVVEALRAGWQPGQHEHGQVSARVQAVIDSRLAQLSDPARDLVGVAATIGREFSSDLLANASEADEDTLVRTLDELWRRHILREQGTVSYDFSHDKIREVAYLGLSPALRSRNHLRVARALERLYSADLGPVSAQLAAHYERAGRANQAINWYERAAEVAQQMHANTEAIRLLDQALYLLHALPEGHDRQAHELAILTALPAPLSAIEGYWSSRMTQVQQRALDLTRALAVEPEAPLLRSLALASLSQGDFEMAQVLGERLRAGGEREGDDVLVVEGAYVLGIVAFWQGEFEAARRHFEIAVERYRTEHRRAHLLRYGQDPQVVCLSRLGNTLWFLGRSESAVHARDAALALADETKDPVSHSVALLFAAMLSLELGEVEQLREYADRATAPQANHATPVQLPAKFFSDGLSGYVEVLDGHPQAGIARIKRALNDAQRAKNAPGNDAIVMRLLLAACNEAGAALDGLAATETALTMGGARTWVAEVHRLRGEFLAASGGAANDVEVEFERAIEMARRQGAPALALRAAVSLVRHRVARGDGPGASEAYDLLVAIVDTFPEGRDTPDLREATALLARR
jgi:DNA-binding SARP family transcriptional activator